MKKLLFSGLTFLFASLCVPLTFAAEEIKLSGEEVFKQCGYKNRGNDQKSRFIVERRDNKGSIRRGEYLRFWKDFKGRDGVADKMVLFQTYPPVAKGAAFMRTTYVPEFKQGVDQWIYLPLLKKIRRVTIRNPGDSFLNTDLAYADVNPRELNEDNHKYLGIREKNDLQFYLVESVPKEEKPLYSKRVYWFKKGQSWDDCVNVRVNYYDVNGAPLKDQIIKWQKVDGAWVWSRVLVKNLQTGTSSGFVLTNLAINSNIEDSLFTERSLIKGATNLMQSGKDEKAAKKTIEQK